MKNTCFLIGNLGSDPVERARNEKTGPIVGFTVAENVQTFDKESREFKTVHTNWFNVTAFGNLAERTLNGIRKGDRVAVQGRMKVSKFTDKTGQDRTSFEIIAEEIAHWQTLPSAGAGRAAADESSHDESQSVRPAAMGRRNTEKGRVVAPGPRALSGAARDHSARDESLEDDSLPF